MHCAARRGLLHFGHMKKYIVLLALVLLPASTAYAASTDYYIKIPDIDGESTESSSAPTTSATARVVPGADGQEKPQAEFKVEEGEAVRSTGVEPDEIDSKASGDSREEQKGNVETEWKVEKGESALHSNFAVLLDSSRGGDEGSEQTIEELEGIVKQGLEEQGQPVETLSLNFDKVKAKTKHKVKLFGFIPVNATVDVEVDRTLQTSVHFPWWTFLASGKDKTGVGASFVDTLMEAINSKTPELAGAANKSE